MKKWTDAQLAAITSDKGDVLVSAAAGSGKTTAMTERIIRKIEDGGDISRFLIVTFSRASAADMKKKITSALRARAAENPNNKRLARQAARVGDAAIGTIHSFCYSLVKRHFGELSLSAQVRVPDEAETALMRAECMSDTFDHFYAADRDIDSGDPATSFPALTDQLAGSRDDKGMAGTLLSLYEKTSCLPRRYLAIADAALTLEKAGGEGFLSSECGEPIRRRVSDGLDYYIHVMEEACRVIAEVDVYAERYRAGFEGSLDAVRRIKALLETGDYSATAEAIGSYAPPKLGAVRGEKPPEIDYFCRRRTELGAFLRGIKKEYFSVSEKALDRSVRRTAAVCRGIVRVLDEFDRRYSEEKRRRAIIDYNDLEHMALSLLSQKDIAAAVAGEYDEIYIDEYQDVNSVQDAIFAAISRENRFMVGDVKQSIYGFRGAEPAVFDRYRRDFTASCGGEAVFMSDNFRCDLPVVEFTNAVCGGLMKHGNVSYTAEDALRHGKEEDGEGADVGIILTTREEEPAVVAKTVAELIRGGRRPEDIAILLRSAKSRASAYEDALRDVGVTSANDARANFFECPEILLVLCLLHTADNPLYDIYTAGALRSPVFGFSLDELTRLKKGDNRPVFRVLRDGAEGKLDIDEALAAKCRDAHDTICRWQNTARTLSSDEFIRRIYRETGIEALLWARENREDKTPPEMRAENLSALAEYARGFESGGFRGLHRFLSYLDSMIEGGMNNPVKREATAEGSVRIMTIHQSKGLEFPVVIMAGCGADRNERDAREPVLWNRTVGAAMKLRADDEGESTVVVDTLPRRAVAAAVLHESAAEEMRILYVALTRAKERLVITAGVRDPETFADEARREAEFFCAHTVEKEKTMIGWILTSLFASQKDGFYTVETQTQGKSVTDTPEVAEEADAELTEHTQEETEEFRAEVEKYRALIRERLSYRYPYEKLGALPAKLSVSRLEPDILDVEEEDAVMLPAAKTGEENESALCGTATHLFLQFCDFDRAAQDAVSEGERLVKCGFITEESFSRIRFDEIRRFFASDIYARMRGAERVWREQRFNVRLPASDFTQNEEDKRLYHGEELLVQGVVDCFFREADGGIVLLDYKTDRLTPYELSHPRAAAEKLTERHARQLSYYRAALGKIFGVPPTHTYIYSLHLGEAIEVR